MLFLHTVFEFSLRSVAVTKTSLLDGFYFIVVFCEIHFYHKFYFINSTTFSMSLEVQEVFLIV